MITPSHIVYAWALARSRIVAGASSAQKTTAFVLGAIAPDVPVYLFFIVEGLLLGHSHAVLWDTMYFQSWWSIVFTLSHSMILWPALFGVAWLCKAKVVRWFALSELFIFVRTF